MGQSIGGSGIWNCEKSKTGQVRGWKLQQRVTKRRREKKSAGACGIVQLTYPLQLDVQVVSR